MQKEVFITGTGLHSPDLGYAEIVSLYARILNNIDLPTRPISLFEQQVLTNHMAKWVFLLSKFDITYMTRKAIKGQIIADLLDSNPILGEEEQELEYPDECIINIDVEKEWHMFFDGASNKNGNGIGILLIAPDGIDSPLSFRLDFECANNITEYKACIFGLEIALQRGVKTILVHRDFALLIYQVLKKWWIKEERLVPYYPTSSNMLSSFTSQGPRIDSPTPCHIGIDDRDP